MVYPKALENTKLELRILYLDDEEIDRENFMAKVNRYNVYQATGDTYKLIVEIYSDYTEVLDALERNPNGYDVIICDHNMPEKKGVEFIVELLQREAEYNFVYVLYTAAGNLSPKVRKDCIENDILFFEKTEQLSTLVRQLINKVNTNNDNPLDKFYYKLSGEIIKDMLSIEQFDPAFRLHIGNRTLTPADLIDELNNRTPLAFDYINSYIEGLKFFNN